MKTCSKCGFVGEDGMFVKIGNMCKACLANYKAEYRKTHKEKIRKHMAEYYLRHRDEIARNHAEYYLLHREEVLARVTKYRRAHKEECNRRCAEHRATHRKEYAEYYDLHKKEYRDRSRRYYHIHRPQLCAMVAERQRDLKRRMLACDPKEIEKFYIESERLTQETGIRYSVDHIIPIKGKTVWGLHVPWNLRVMPLADNVRKWNKFEAV